jgi:cytochrome c556
VIESKRLSVSSALALALALGAAPLALSGPSPDEAIAARQKAMEGVGGAMKPLVAIAKKETPFDAAVVRKNAEAIAASLKAAEGHFPAGSEKGSVETFAKATVWSDGAGFAAAMKASRDAAAAMAGVTEEAAFGPAMKALGGSCKGCHEAYRVPKR